jgi:hypothetical protein
MRFWGDEPRLIEIFDSSNVPLDSVCAILLVYRSNAAGEHQIPNLESTFGNALRNIEIKPIITWKGLLWF